MIESLVLFALTLVVVPCMMLVTIFAALVTFGGVVLAAKDSLTAWVGRSRKHKVKDLLDIFKVLLVSSILAYIFILIMVYATEFINYISE